MKYIKWVLVAGYVYFILTKTIIGRTVFPESMLRGLFWEIRKGYWNNILMNILLFIPLGFLIGGWRGIAVGLFLSCRIEMTQYFGRLGYCEADDIMNNTIGTCIGSIARMLIHKFYYAIKKKSRDA